ncbi:hypothetical protein IC232_31870 [Microvirga sp. BT688]|uniref:hypothetical protein n=1 Tax=Microvirga sp. TaxID=1873136 RepID=UPI001684DF83|nr:hypothetical protein [Microvirga sp.]MBD2751230.1 hypothetical protein [Microvirga sp.]
MLEKRKVNQMVRIWLGLVIGLGMIAPASASFGDAWQAMPDKLRTGCVSKATAMGLGRIEINVDPFGSPSYGIAVLTKRGADRKQSVAYVCIMQKKTGAFEIGGEFPLR